MPLLLVCCCPARCGSWRPLLPPSAACSLPTGLLSDGAVPLPAAPLVPCGNCSLRPVLCHVQAMFQTPVSAVSLVAEELHFISRAGDWACSAGRAGVPR